MAISSLDTHMTTDVQVYLTTTLSEACDEDRKVIVVSTEFNQALAGLVFD